MASKFDQFCVKKNLIRETMVSETYRARFKLGEKQSIYDITRYPGLLPEAKKAKLKEILPSDMDPDRYISNLVLRNVYELISLSQERNGGEPEKTVVIPKAFDVDKETMDFFLVTDPVEPLIGNFEIEKDSITIQSLLVLMYRMIIALERLGKQQIHVGEIRMENLSILEKEDTQLILLNSLLDFSRDGEELKRHPLSRFEDKEVIKGEVPRTLKTDLRALARLVWTIAAGNSYDEVPDLNIEPEYAPEELKVCLKKLLSDEEIDLPFIKRVIPGMARRFQKGELENYKIRFENQKSEESFKSDDVSTFENNAGEEKPVTPHF